MIEPMSTATCFALLLISPQPASQPFVIHGYPSIESASAAKRDAVNYEDAEKRIMRERYEATPAYKKEQAERQANDSVTSFTLGTQTVTVNFSNPVVSYIPWEARIIPEPCQVKAEP